MASKDHPGCTWCGNCGKWKADKAFVRSRFKRGTQRWERCGFVWKKYKACNRCSRLYYHKPEMSVAEFVEQYGAEEHNEYVLWWAETRLSCQCCLPHKHLLT